MMFIKALISDLDQSLRVEILHLRYASKIQHRNFFPTKHLTYTYAKI